MPTLKEIKGRIASVRSTLKITSAMKLVASAKLRRTQTAIENMRRYEQQLQAILSAVQPDGGVLAGGAFFQYDRASLQSDRASLQPGGASAIVAIASNSSLCGGFNAAAIAKLRSVRSAGDTVYSVGRKMADAMRKDGFPSPEDLSELSEHPSYTAAAQLFDRLAEDYRQGKVDRVLLVYTHFESTARQVPVVEVLLDKMAPHLCQEDIAHFTPASSSVLVGPSVQPAAPVMPGSDVSVMPGTDQTSDSDWASVEPIIEPSREELLKVLVPKVLRLKVYAALLDSAAAEHAARTVAMQTATDNAEDLLSELTLQYNKGRQQKITAEILDLAGGQAE